MSTLVTLRRSKRFRAGAAIVSFADLKPGLSLVSRSVVFIATVLLASAAGYAQLSVTLNASHPSPQPVGRSIALTAAVNSSSTALRYRFMVQPPGASSFNMLADYGTSDGLRWSALEEGGYQIQVDVVDSTSGATGSTTMSFQFTSRVSGGAPVVSSSVHPLVAIYSAPACAEGTIQVAYWVSGKTNYQYSNILPCQPGLSANFYIGGMRAETTYALQQMIVNKGRTTWGPVLTFTTGALGQSLPVATISTPVGAGTSHSEDMILQSYIGLSPGRKASTVYPPVAYNLAGQVIWYYPATHIQGTYLTRPVAGGTFLLYIFNRSADETVVEEVDLQGDIVRETNAYTISQQLIAMGQPTINWMSHEALRLPSGHTLVLGMTERILTNEQGPGAVDVVGDMIIDLDQNLQVAWVWNTFDHLPNNRPPVLAELCKNNVAPCGPLYLAAKAIDWTHCNSLYLLPDGNLVLSVRNQDWVVKINYQNGAGDGQIFWTLGNLASQAGTPYFTLKDGYGSWPWFSHQHDVEFDGTNYELFDNGNTRVSPPPVGVGSGYSRGQVYSLDEVSMVATQLLSAELGRYSGGFGSAQLLANGDYWFTLGFLNNDGAPLDSSQEIVSDNPVTESYSINFPSSAYRSFRLSSLYEYTN